jgi:hypothetical protein
LPTSSAAAADFRAPHGLSNPLAPCGGASDTDDNDVKRGDDMTGWLVNAIMGSPVWEHGRNAIFIVFDEGTAGRCSSRRSCSRRRGRLGQAETANRFRFGWSEVARSRSSFLLLSAPIIR